MINRFFDTPAHDHQTVSYDATDGFPMSWESTPPPTPTETPETSGVSSVLARTRQFRLWPTEVVPERDGYVALAHHFLPQHELARMHHAGRLPFAAGAGVSPTRESFLAEIRCGGVGRVILGRRATAGLRRVDGDGHRLGPRLVGGVRSRRGDDGLGADGPPGGVGDDDDGRGDRHGDLVGVGLTLPACAQQGQASGEGEGGQRGELVSPFGSAHGGSFGGSKSPYSLFNGTHTAGTS